MISITFPGGKKVNASFGDGTVVSTDQPVKYGGEGSAPTPYELFLASIGTCAGIYVLGFCRERNIPTDGVTLSQGLRYISPASGAPRLERVELEINVPPEFPEKYRDALVKVAGQCAVKKTMTEPPAFDIRTVVKTHS